MKLSGALLIQDLRFNVTSCGISKLNSPRHINFVLQALAGRHAILSSCPAVARRAKMEAESEDQRELNYKNKRFLIYF
jgi:hypothetical protein